MGHVLDLVVRDGGNLAWAQRENVLLQAAEHRAMDIQQVAGNADADDLAVAGAVELATRGEPAQQEVAMIQASSGPDDDFMPGIAALHPARFP